jgi:hypothetical protein
LPGRGLQVDLPWDGDHATDHLDGPIDADHDELTDLEAALPLFG